MAYPSSFVKVLTIIVFIFMAHEGETLKCWNCQSPGEIGTGCADPFTGSPTRDKYFTNPDCERYSSSNLKSEKELLPDGTIPKQNNSRLNFFCYKITSKVLGTNFFKRGCASSLHDITATSCLDWKTQMTHSPLGPSPITIDTCDVCTGDLCNGATNVVGTIVILFAPFLLVLT